MKGYNSATKNSIDITGFSRIKGWKVKVMKSCCNNEEPVLMLSELYSEQNWKQPRPKATFYRFLVQTEGEPNPTQGFLLGSCAAIKNEWVQTPENIIGY